MELKIHDKSFEAFKGFINLIKTVVEEANLKVSEEELRVNTMDPTHVAMIDVAAKPGLFDTYSGKDAKNPICFNVGDLGRFLDRMDKKEQITIKTDVEKAKMLIQGRKSGMTRRFQVILLEPTEEEVPEPKILFKSKIRILTPAFDRAIKDADLVSEHIIFEAKEDGEFKISASGNLGDAMSLWERGSDEVLEASVTENSSATYTLSYLKDILSALKPVADEITIELATDMPIRLEADCPTEDLHVVYYLAPCIGV